MKFKVFDVVKLNNNNKATIIEITGKNKYKLDVVNKDGISHRE